MPVLTGATWQPPFNLLEQMGALCPLCCSHITAGRVPCPCQAASVAPTTAGGHKQPTQGMPLEQLAPVGREDGPSRPQGSSST